MPAHFVIPEHHSGAAMKKSDFLIVFTLGGQRYALPLSAADRVVRMVAITPLPNAPDIILGVVNFQGRIIPVINMRRRFCLPEREVSLTDQLVVAHTARRPVALVTDAVLDVIACSAQSLIATENILPKVEYLEGVVKLADGLILIHDLDKFLSLEEENSLDRALENRALENQAPENRTLETS
jgi:purine-binding chemotaxis protein CheW